MSRIDELRLLAKSLESVTRYGLETNPEIELKEYFRMADFTRFGCAIAEALGNKKEDFIEAYREKVKLQNEEAVNQDPVALTIMSFCRERFQK